MPLTSKSFYRVFLTLILFCLLMPPQETFAQGNVGLVVHYIEGSPIDGKVGYEVSVYLSAFDSNGSSISDLNTDNFRVTEDSKQVEIATLDRSSNLPMSVVLLIDTSGSMQGTAIQNARNAASTFITSLNSNDQIAIATFNEQMEFLSDFSTDLQQAASKVNLINAENLASTCLYDAAYSAVEKSATLESGRRAIILLTDGQDYKSSGACSVHTLDDVIGLASEGSTRVPIFTIGLGDEIDEKGLKRLSDMSGGVFLYAPNSSQLQNVFSRLSSQLRSQYVITYQSSAAPGPHSLAVEMKYDNQTVQDARKFTLPELPVNLILVSPREGQEIEGTAKLAATLSAGGSNIEKVVFRLDSQEIASDTTTPYELDYSFNKDQLGAHVLTAAAITNDGTELTSASVSIYVKEASTAASIINSGSSFLSNPLALVLMGGGGLILIGALVLMTRKKKKAVPVFSDDFKPRDEKSESDDHTIDFISLHEEKPPLSHEDVLATLTILFSDDQAMIGQQLSVRRLPASIGRGTTNDIMISKKDGAVSRDHIVLDWQNNHIAVREAAGADELGNPKYPSYGTFVNEKNIRGKTVLLDNNDEIRLGTRFRLKINFSSVVEGSDDRTMDGIDLSDLGETREFTRDGDDS